MGRCWLCSLGQEPPPLRVFNEKQVLLSIFQQIILPNSLATSSLLKAEELPFSSSWSIYQKRPPCTEQRSWSMNISWDQFGGGYLQLSFHGK